MQLFKGQRDLLGSYFHHLVGLTHSPIRFIKLQHKNKVLTRREMFRYISVISEDEFVFKQQWLHRSGWMARLIRPLLARVSGCAVLTYRFSCFCGNIVVLWMTSQLDTSKVMHHKNEQRTAKWISKNEDDIIYSTSCRFKPLQNAPLV